MQLPPYTQSNHVQVKIEKPLTMIENMEHVYPSSYTSHKERRRSSNFQLDSSTVITIPTETSLTDNVKFNRSNRHLPGSNEVPSNHMAQQRTIGDVFLMCLSGVLTIFTFPFSLICCLRFIKEYQRAVVLRLGRQHEESLRPPGLTIILPWVDRCVKIDLRTRMFIMQPQRVLSKDCVTLSVDAAVFYKIIEPMASVLKVEDAHQATKLLSQTILRNAIATRSLASVLTKREQMAEEILEAIQVPAKVWGVKIERIEVKDIRIPGDMQRAMAAEAEANRNACARLISAEAERDASPYLLGAAQNFQMEPMSLQLRYLHTLNAISAENNSTIVVPFPTEFLKKTFQNQRRP